MGANFLINSLGFVVTVSFPDWWVTFGTNFTHSFFPDCLERDVFLQILDELTIELPPEANLDDE